MNYIESNIKKVISDKKIMPEAINNITVTDEELMLRVFDGDKRAYVILVSRWNKTILNFFFRSTGEREISEELCQDVFICVWKAKNYNPKAPFYSWIYKIAKNKLIDHYRKKKLQIFSIENNPEVSEISVNTHQCFDDKLIEQEEEKMLITAINDLPQDQRMLLILSKYQKLNYEDIGKIMDCTADNVKVKVFRSVKSLVKKFKELYKYE